MSELLALPVSAATSDERVLLSREKAAAKDWVPLNDAARAALKSFLALRRQPKGETDSSHLFASRGGAGHLTRQHLGQELKALAAEAGLTPSKISPHVLRHALPAICSPGALISERSSRCWAMLIYPRRNLHACSGRALRKIVETHHPLGKPPKGPAKLAVDRRMSDRHFRGNITFDGLKRR